MVAAGCSGGSGGGSSDGTVAIDFAWWGDSSRAERYEKAVALFEEQNPGIDVRTSYGSFADYWSARNVEAAGASLPDVMQMDLSYLSEYAESGRIAPLDDYFGDGIDVSTLADEVVEAAQVDGATYGVPTSTNTMATIVNLDLLEELGVPAPEGQLTWDEYDAFLRQVGEAGASRSPAVHGASDYTQVISLFQVWLGQRGKTLFQDGKLGFDKADLAEWWGRAAPVFDGGGFIPVDRLTQLEGVDAIGAGETASEVSWDNFLVRFSEGTQGAHLAMLPPPADDPADGGLYLKPSLMLSIASQSDAPEEAAKLVDFLTNDPEVGKLFGLSRGVPSSQTALEGLEAEGLDAQVLEYEQSLEGRFTNTPPPSVKGFGAVEAAFIRINQDLAYGSVTLDEAVDQWFTEAEGILAG
jgi:multiple sugar transport system substrate-binding protein